MVIFAGVLLVLTGFAVLAVDIGRIFIVRGEMQNVADATALAGANCLTRQSGAGTTDCLSTMANALNWTRAVANAQAQLSQNQADNRSISSSDAGHVIDVGYWDLLNKRPSGGTLPTSPMSTTFSPIGTYDKPAIRVKVSKAAGQNGGPILMLTRLMFGGVDVPMSATAVAVISSPGGVLTGNLIPMAIDKCLFDTYWDSTTGSPKLADSNKLTVYSGKKPSNIQQTIGAPWVFQMGSAYSYANCQATQWTSFAVGNNSASYAAGLISTGNPTPLNIGDLVYIQPGAETTLFKNLIQQYPSLPVDVTVMVVNYNLSTSGSAPIYAFAGFRITAIVDGSGKYIQGSFVNSEVSSGASGIGPFFGTYTPPRLAY